MLDRLHWSRGTRGTRGTGEPCTHTAHGEREVQLASSVLRKPWKNREQTDSGIQTFSRLMSLSLRNDARFTDEEMGFRSGTFPRSLGHWAPRGSWRPGSGSTAVVTGRVPSNASLWRPARLWSCSGKSSGSCRALLSHRVLVGRSDLTVWFRHQGEVSHRGVISEALRGRRALWQFCFQLFRVGLTCRWSRVWNQWQGLPEPGRSRPSRQMCSPTSLSQFSTLR